MFDPDPMGQDMTGTTSISAHSKLGGHLTHWLRRQWQEHPTRAWLLVGALILIWSGLGSISFNDKVPLDDWKHDLRADAAGYYVYLPAFFHHGWKANGYSEEMRRTIAGEGFLLDRQRDRVVTKYPIGTAMLQLPFFLVAELIEGPGATDGWTRTHHRAIEVAGSFYWAAGIILLALTLMARSGRKNGTIAVVLASISFGTNVYYYAFRSPGYSHIYSFFLVCAALYLIFSDRKEVLSRTRQMCFMAVVSLLFLVRHIDVLAVVALFALLWFEHPQVLRSPGYWWRQLLVGLVLALPQLAYWKHVHGKWIVQAYGNEGFSNWAHPYWSNVLFSPQNGIIPYAPVVCLIPLALLALWAIDRKHTMLLIALFVAVIYSFAAWHMWNFGCSYGMRPFVQYMPFLAIPLMALLLRIERWSPALFGGVVTLLALVSFVNYRALLQFDVCYVGEADDWIPYGRNLVKAFFGDVDL